MLGVIVPQMRAGEQSRKASTLGPQPKKRVPATVELTAPQAGEDREVEETSESWHMFMGGARGSKSSKANVMGADLLAEVFSRLPFEERLRTVPLVCKAWRSASCDPACWRQVDMEGWFEKRVEEDYWWEFECEPRVEFLVKKIVDRSCGQLRELRTMHCSDEAIEYIADRCPLLTVLSIRNSPLVTDKSASKLAASCPEIQELDVSDCYNISNQALEALRQWKPCKLQIKPLVLYFFWQHMLRIYMSSCKLQSQT